MMKVNKWTLGLAAVGLISLPALAEEKLSPVQTLVSSTTIGGWVDTAAHWNLGSGNRFVPAYGLNTAGKADGFNLNVVDIYIEKPLDATDNWAAGYKVELALGQDAQTFLNTGGLGTYPIKQAYVSLRAPVGNGIDFKVGQFDTIIGYESFNAAANPNYTRSYGFAIEPRNHTGILGTYQLNKMIGVAAGIANTAGPTAAGKAWQFGQAESYKAYMGAITVTAPEDLGFLAGSTLYGGVVNGLSTRVGGLGFAADTTSWYVGATLNTPLKALKLGVAYDYLGVSGQDLTGDRSGYANALAGYASFQVTEKLSLHSRSEFASVTPAVAGAGRPESVFAQTATVQYDLWKNVISRLEFRWDHNLSGDRPTVGAWPGDGVFGGSNPGSASDSGLEDNAFLVALNIIYKF